jgi:hypothetical protein
MPQTTWRRVAVLTIAVSLVAAGCGGGDSDEGASGRKAEPNAGNWKPWLLSSP